ncbi:MAG: hypothetical protein JWP94_566 [Mucilaginibacter sp.]|nr:hypothetical protein [Mucilaginibacter sp.]
MMTMRYTMKNIVICPVQRTKYILVIFQAAGIR